nr:MAG TPA: zinc-ribbon protein [Caudoviricetes sp.]
MSCQHEFIGTREGVRCEKCGLFFTPEEYTNLQVRREKGGRKEGERVSTDAGLPEGPAVQSGRSSSRRKR